MVMLVRDAHKFFRGVLHLGGQQVFTRPHARSGMLFVQEVRRRGDVQIARTALGYVEFHVVVLREELEAMMMPSGLAA